jgi:hypothetical protein
LNLSFGNEKGRISAAFFIFDVVRPAKLLLLADKSKSDSSSGVLEHA